MMDYQTVPTICPYCGCGCGILLKVANGRISGVIPAADHPVNNGKLCIKGWNAHEFIHDPDRLLEPLIRKGEEFVAVDWEEAIRVAARGFKEVIRLHGAEAVGGLCSAKCTNEENYLFQKLMRAALGTNNVDHCARLCHAPTVVGMSASFGSGAMTNAIWELAEAECILIIGSNVSENHPMAAERIYRAKDRGATLVVIDPRRTQMAEQAHIHLRLRPGTDVALINGMMHAVLERDLQNHTFVKDRTEGFQSLRKGLERYNPSLVEEITGVPANLLEQGAVAYAKAKNASIVFCMGITQHTTGTDNVKALCNLSMLCGQVGRKGTGINPLRGQNNVQGACDMGGLPGVLPGYQPVGDPQVIKTFENAWRKRLPSKPGLTLTEMIDKGGRQIRAMLVMGENPVMSDPDAQSVEETLRSLDFLVVLDIFMTETTRLADVVFPSACFAEKDGTFTNTERRVQLIRRAVPPPGRALADHEIISQLSTALGYPMHSTSPARVMDEVASLTPSYGGINHRRLAGSGIQWPCTDETHPGTLLLHKDRFVRGKGRFQPVEFHPPKEEPDPQYPFYLLTGRSFAHYHTGTMSRRSPSLEMELKKAYVEIHPEDARQLGVVEDDEVEVTSRRGKIQLCVRITPRVDSGTVFIPFHFAEAAANILTNPALDDVAKIPELKVCAVRVRKL